MSSDSDESTDKLQNVDDNQLVLKQLKKGTKPKSVKDSDIEVKDAAIDRKNDEVKDAAIEVKDSDIEGKDAAIEGKDSDIEVKPIKTPTNKKKPSTKLKDVVVPKVEKKKRPGRPRKTPIREPRPRNGIVTNSKDPQNFVEFLYDKPLIFRKLWQYFKLMAVEKIQLIFRKNEIIMWGEDHHKKSKMRIRIDANNVNHYFVTDELDIGVACKNPELVMATIDKTYTSILFLSKVNYAQKDIRIILNNEIEIDESHTIELIGEYDKMTDEDKFMDMEHTIKFELPGRYFKKMISDIRTFSDQITIRHDGVGEPLIFEYTEKNKKIKSYNVVRNNNAIKFESKLKNDDTFRVSFNIDYVKPISAALLAENITIYAHENKPLMFHVGMDKNTVDLRILTEIIDERAAI